jgi:hypothetical protein
LILLLVELASDEQKKTYMSEHVRPKHYRKEPLGWAPQFMALWISRVLFYPTLIYNVTLYYLWPTKFRTPPLPSAIEQPHQHTIDASASLPRNEQ